MNAAVESAGGSLNGITARDHGCYYTPIHPDEVGTGLAVLGDLIRRPLLKEMDVEREVILEEILDEVDADGRDIDPDNLSKRIVFGDHPLGVQDRGHAGDRPPARAARRSARTTRASTPASNLVLAVAGPVRAAEVEALAEEHLGALPRGRASIDLRAAALAGRAAPRARRARRRAGGVLPLVPLPARAPPRLPGPPLHPAHPRRRALFAASLRDSSSGAASPTRCTPGSTPSPTRA